MPGEDFNDGTSLGAPSNSEPPARARSEPSPAGPCILVAEDEDMVRELAVRVLRGQGMRVLSARHGGEAVALFRSHAEEIDAVLLDLTMPVMGGAEVLSELQRVRPGVCVLVTSGYSESASFGADGERARVRFLQKPYRAQSLLAGVEAVLAASTSATPAP
jgi:two-component system cell cycle sensor histidine kinase/response regulator CckA